MSDEQRVKNVRDAVENVVDEDGDGVWHPENYHLRTQAADMIARAAIAALDDARDAEIARLREALAGALEFVECNVTGKTRPPTGVSEHSCCEPCQMRLSARTALNGGDDG